MVELRSMKWVIGIKDHKLDFLCWSLRTSLAVWARIIMRRRRRPPNGIKDIC